MAITRKVYMIEYFPVMGESGYVSEVDWDKKKFHYKVRAGEPIPFRVGKKASV